MLTPSPSIIFREVGSHISLACLLVPEKPGWFRGEGGREKEGGGGGGGEGGSRGGAMNKGRREGGGNKW